MGTWGHTDCPPKLCDLGRVAGACGACKGWRRESATWGANHVHPNKNPEHQGSGKGAFLGGESAVHAVTEVVTPLLAEVSAVRTTPGRRVVGSSCQVSLGPWPGQLSSG